MEIDEFSDYRGKTVLVTGAGGFIGGHLINWLSRFNCNVIAATRLEGAGTAKIAASVIRMDVADLLQVQEVMEATKPDIVFNLAAQVSGPKTLESLAIQMQVTFGGAVNVAKAASDNKVQMLVQAGSSEEYGDGPVPFVESQKERPISPYSAAKVAATHTLLMLARKTDLSCVVARPSCVYGPGQFGNMAVPHLFNCYLNKRRAELSKGEQTRDFLYIDDLVIGLLKCGLRPDLSGEIVNFGSAEPCKLKVLAEMVASLCDFTGPLGLGRISYRKPEIMDHQVSYDKAKTLINWQPSINLAEGLSKTLSWWIESKASCDSILS